MPKKELEQTLHSVKAIRALHELKEEKVLAAAAGPGAGTAKK